MRVCSHYTAAIEVEATESRLFNRAFLHMRRNRIPEAIEGYKRVVDLAPGNFQVSEHVHIRVGGVGQPR